MSWGVGRKQFCPMLFNLIITQDGRLEISHLLKSCELKKLLFFNSAVNGSSLPLHQFSTLTVGQGETKVRQKGSFVYLPNLISVTFF